MICSVGLTRMRGLFFPEMQFLDRLHAENTFNLSINLDIEPNLNFSILDFRAYFQSRIFSIFRRKSCVLKLIARNSRSWLLQNWDGKQYSVVRWWDQNACCTRYQVSESSLNIVIQSTTERVWYSAGLDTWISLILNNGWIGSVSSLWLVLTVGSYFYIDCSILENMRGSPSVISIVCWLSLDRYIWIIRFNYKLDHSIIRREVLHIHDGLIGSWSKMKHHPLFINSCPKPCLIHLHTRFTLVLCAIRVMKRRIK